MISSILSGIFRLCFFLTIAAGLIAVTAQLIQRPIRIPAGNNSYISLAEPGLRLIPQQAISAKERPAVPVNNSTDLLRVVPANGLQQAGFILYLLVRFSALAFLFIFLSRLFGHFSRKIFFTPGNILLLKRTGWLLLLPCLATAALYLVFLVNMHPIKLVMDGADNYRPIASFELTPGIDWTLIILGVGLLVLGYIFRGGLKLEQENEKFL